MSRSWPARAYRSPGGCPRSRYPLGREFKDVVVASRGDLEIFGFHALETLQCMVERRERTGKPQGVSAVTCLEGDAVWAGGRPGRLVVAVARARAWDEATR